MSTKDPFTIFADELTLLRNDIRKLQRSSLNRDEAKALTDLIGEYLQGFINIAEGFDEAVEQRLALTKSQIITETTIAAKAAATNAIQTSHTEIMSAARIYSQNAGEARREAWRYFEKLDPEKNLARFYSLTILPNLFGEWSLQREWGRIGRNGQMRVAFFPSHSQALQAFHQIKTAKIKRGYQVIPQQLSLF